MKFVKSCVTLLKNIPKIFYNTTALAKRETIQVEGEETLMKLVREDRGPDIKNVRFPINTMPNVGSCDNL